MTQTATMAPAATREEWLLRVTEEVRSEFARISFPLPAKIRMACGWTSKGERARAIGECWHRKCSKD